MDDYIKPAIGLGVFFILLSAIVVPSFGQTQDEIENVYEDITTETNWNDVVNTSASSDYNVTSSGTIEMAGSSGVVQTDVVNTDSHDRLELYANTTSTGDVDVTLYNGTGTQLKTQTVTAGDNVTLDVQDYSEDSYYVEFASATSSDSEVTEYKVTGFDDVQESTSTLIYIVLLMFLVGIAIAGYKQRS